MARLIAPNGSTVNVSDEKAKTLLTQGFKSAERKSSKAATEKPSSSKSSK